MRFLDAVAVGCMPCLCLLCIMHKDENSTPETATTRPMGRIIKQLSQENGWPHESTTCLCEDVSNLIKAEMYGNGLTGLAQLRYAYSVPGQHKWKQGSPDAGYLKSACIWWHWPVYPDCCKTIGLCSSM